MIIETEEFRSREQHKSELKSEKKTSLEEINLPDLGEGIEGAEVSDVMVSAGQSISKNDILLVLESDKSSMEIPSDYSGTVVEVFVNSGDEVSTGQKLMIIETEEFRSREQHKNELKSEIKKELQTDSREEKKPPVNFPKTSRDVFASPGVRKLARELEINLQLLSGSGPKGRITKEDLHGYIKAKMESSTNQRPKQKKEIDFSIWGEVEVLKLTKVNRITGARLQEAWQEIPHVTQYDFGDITELDEVRKKLKKEGEKKQIKVTFLPFLMKAVAAVLKEMPRFNSSLDYKGENLVMKNYYHFGVAVDTPSGLIVPVIKDVDKKSIFELSSELMDISERARNKNLLPDELRGGTFTISSLGGIGGAHFSPIVNPPEVAILGVSKSEWRQTHDGEGKAFSARYILPFSLSYDHRVIDGASGAAFTTRLSQVLNTKGFFEN
tara:strand:- start:719 stop:2035 length:1317 start_codon:yes stop_codon:yes gene_type:complete